MAGFAAERIMVVIYVEYPSNMKAKHQRPSLRKYPLAFIFPELAYLMPRKITKTSNAKNMVNPVKKGIPSELTKKMSNFPAVLMVY
jgi:hypothetical protein